MNKKLMYLLAVLPFSACLCAPEAGQPCMSDDENRCGVANGRDHSLLICEGGTWVGYGACVENVGCNDAFTDDQVLCGDFPELYAMAEEGKACTSLGKYACSSTRPEIELKCVGGTWQLQKDCVQQGKTLCGPTDFGDVGCN
ncbi:MAG: hypothetical protein ABIJ09_23230 [Pseudomonadota bacterium]